MSDTENSYTDSLKSFFDNLFVNTKFDAKLAKELYNFQVLYTNRNDDHIAYFGSGLTGVSVVRFTSTDMLNVLENILNIDYKLGADELLKVKTVNHAFVVSSDFFNLAMLYTTYRFANSPYLDQKKRDRAQLDTILILNYKLMGGLLSHYFKYPADQHAATATFSNLSYRFALKRLGTWSAWYNYRATEILDKTSIHRVVFDKFTDDQATTYAAADIQGRVRDTLKNIYAEYVKVLEKGEKLGQSTSTGTNYEGEDELLDKVGGIQDYINYIKSISHDYNSLYKSDLVHVIDKVVLGGNKRHFGLVLEWIAANSTSKEYDEFITHLLTYSFNYLNEHSFLRDQRDLTGFLFDLKNGIMSSKSIDPDLKAARTISEHLVTTAVKEYIGKASLMSTKTMVMLYLAIRAFKK